MKAVVVYESMYGNTREVAEHVAEGLRAAAVDVDVFAVGAAVAPGSSLYDTVRSADLLVVGGPTHAHSMSREGTRKAAVAQAQSPDKVIEPDVGPLGVREWFDALPAVSGIAAAAFDTRADAAKVLTGQASRGIAKQLRGHGFRLVVPAESFIVDKVPHLLAGEDDRATKWGHSLAEIVDARAAVGVGA